jgi:hypothetical protein
VKAKRKAISKDIDDDEGAEVDEQERLQYDFHCKAHFGLVILDDGHKNKNGNTQTYVALEGTLKQKFLVLSATPMFRLSGREAARFMGYIVLEGTEGQMYENSSSPIPVTNLIDAAWLSQMLFGPSFAHIAHPHIN